MSDKHKCIAMIPARIGSARLKAKNLALVGGNPLIYYAITAAKDSGVFDRIVVNSDDQIFKEIAHRYKVEFYQRPVELGSSTTKSDDVVIDFIEKNPCDIVAWVNPISPLQKGEEVREVVHHFIREGLDSLITVKDEQVHCVYQDKPVNFELQERFAQTQDLIPVQPFVYSVMIWRTTTFTREYKEKGYSLFCGKTGFYPVSKLAAFIIKREEDLMLADYIARALAQSDSYQVRYDSLMELSEEKDE